MTTRTMRHGALRPRSVSTALVTQARWIAAGLAVGFLVPFVFADQVELRRDLYYGIYAVIVVAFFVAWTRSTHQRLGEMLRRRWVLALVLGLVFAGVVALGVLRAEDATARPGGLELVGALLWRGVVYGAVDGLLLSAFPILAVFAAFTGSRLMTRWRGKLAVGAVAVVASLAMTAIYHIGYSDFRSSKLGSPVGGDLVWSVPTLVTLNPIGTPIAHVGAHVTAVLHSYETDLLLPPHR